MLIVNMPVTRMLTVNDADSDHANNSRMLTVKDSDSDHANDSRLLIVTMPMTVGC